MLCSCKPHPSGAASRLNKLQLPLDPDLGGCASWINNVCISSDRKLNYIKKTTMERVTGCFLRGRWLPTCAVWRRGRGGTNCGMLLLHLNVCQRNPSSVSFSASFHFVQNSITPSFPLSLPPLSPLSEGHLIQLIWALVHLTSSPVQEGLLCKCMCVFDTSRIVPFAQPLTLISACLLALHLCVLTRHFRSRKSWAKMNYSSGDDLPCRLSPRRRSKLHILNETGSFHGEWGRICLWGVKFALQTSDCGESGGKCSPARKQTEDSDLETEDGSRLHIDQTPPSPLNIDFRENVKEGNLLANHSLWNAVR